VLKAGCSWSAIISVNDVMAFMHHIQPMFWPLVFGVLGSVFGSFITCALYRVPRGESLRQPPSHCPVCDHKLGVLDLVPLFSWLFLRGKCRHCGTKISAYYFFVELVCTVVGVCAFLMAGPRFEAFLLFVVGLCLVFLLFLYVQTHKVAGKTLLSGVIFCVIYALIRC
jgi:leader peptidase (prepilin peptidase)/N-methyltransferase